MYAGAIDVVFNGLPNPFSEILWPPLHQWGGHILGKCTQPNIWPYT